MSVKRVFFLGAGYSKAINPLYPTLTELSDAIIKLFYDEYSQTPLMMHYEKLPNILKNNFESLLSYLYISLPWQNGIEQNLNKALYMALTSKISDYIQTVPHNNYSTDFFKLAKYMHAPTFDKKFKNTHILDNYIITLNYDNLFEELNTRVNIKNSYIPIKDLLVVIPAPSNAINNSILSTEILQCIPSDIKIPEKINLSNFKKFFLINYQQYMNFEYEDLNSTLKTEFGEEYVFPKDKYFVRNMNLELFPNRRIIKLHGSVNEYCIIENERIIKIEKNNEKYKDIAIPYIIPPVLDKNIFYNNAEMQILWNKSYNLLSTADEIYIIGFSFPQTDISIRFLFQTALQKSNAKIYIVNNSTKEELFSNYKYIFDDNSNVDYSYCGSENALLKFSQEFITYDNLE